MRYPISDTQKGFRQKNWGLRKDIWGGNNDLRITSIKVVVETVGMGEMMQGVKKKGENTQILMLTFRGRPRARSLQGRLRKWPKMSEAKWERDASWKSKKFRGRDRQ